MTNIIQFNYDDLQAAIKNCFRESIEEIKNLANQEEKPDRCTITEAEEITGLKQSAIYKMTMQGTIPHKKFHKRLIFSRRELTVWIEQQSISKKSPEETATEHLAKVAKKKLI